MPQRPPTQGAEQRLLREMATTRRRALLSVLAMILAASLPLVGAARPTAQDDLEGLDWLVGEWHRETRSGLSIERWHRLPDGGFVGESVVIRAGGSEEVQVEALLLVHMGADIFYIVRPRQNEYPIGFRLITQTDTEFVFENPTHDFPQRITTYAPRRIRSRQRSPALATTERRRKSSSISLDAPSNTTLGQRRIVGGESVAGRKTRAPARD